ncbi:MAG: cysteine protease [Caulobacteraceae bacterium]|nr:MAG: cysteine protease [Caulobacteraceae bacterium]
MSRLHKLVPILGGLLLSKGGRRVAGRHAGKLALATLAYEVWRNRREGGKPQVTPKPAPEPRARWSGRARR